MASIAFDTLKFANTLKEAGVPEKQAEAEARALKEVLSDFAEERLDDLTTRRDLQVLEVALRRDLQDTEVSLRRDLKEAEVGLRRDLKESELKLEAKLADTKAELVRWVVAVGLLQITIITALLLRLAPG